jgi:hypothetical protein
MASNDYCFLTIWRANASIKAVYSVLMDVQGYLLWWPQVYVFLEPSLGHGPRPGGLMVELERLGEANN